MLRLSLVVGPLLLCWLPAQDVPLRPGGSELFERYCGDCHYGEDHDGEGPDGDFDLQSLLADDVDDVRRRGALLRGAVQRLRAHTMPPPDELQPDREERAQMVALLAARAPTVAGERVATVRRLTRRQYEYTVRDLFGIEWRAGDLLADEPAAHGFDGQGDVQNVSPLMFEKYLDAAASVATVALANDAARERWFGNGTVAALAERLPERLARAFRRPPGDVVEQVAERVDDYARHLDRKSEGRESAQAGADGKRRAQLALLRSVLASPAFLFRAEFGDAREPARLSAHEVAVRLSYMLSSTAPDGELVRLAASGKLLERDVLVAQALRLARADGGRRLAEDFASQWLSLRDVLTATADFRRYPQIWNRKLRPAFLEEALRCFAWIVVEDRPVLELIDADYTFANKVLAKHYGLQAGKGQPKFGRKFARVELRDRRRGGLLGMGAMLMASSFPLRTSPVKRGKWILDKLLDSPPPPPPPDAGTLPKDDKQKDNLTLRQRLEQHRSRRRCAGCHAQMDALGFALENFDVVGRWRDEVHGVAVDAKATLPGGTEVDGPVALKQTLLARADDFVRAMAKNLLVHGVGRNMELADEPEIARIVKSTRADGDRFSAMLAAVVTSPLFLMRDPGLQATRALRTGGNR